MLPRTLDVLLSLAVIAAGSYATVYGHKKIVEAHRPAMLITQAVPKAATIYYIMNGERCVGRLSLGLQQEKALFFEAIADLYTLIGNQQEKFRMEAKGYFNPLGQLSEGTVLISSSAAKLSITARDINPIQLHISLTGGENPYKLSYALPGPLLLKDRGGDFWQLEYQPRISDQHQAVRIISARLGGMIPLRLREAPSEHPTCPENTLGALDLTTIVQNASKLSTALVPGAAN